jgi:hypothetical protein
LLRFCKRYGSASDPGMGLTETSIALGVCGFVLAVALVLDHRPYRPGKLNYIPLMISALAAGLVLGRHLFGLILQQSP